MDRALFEKIIDTTSGVTRVSLNNWGESTLHPDLPAMIGYAKTNGVKTVLLCVNGASFDAPLADRLVRAGLDILEFSLDGSPRRHQAIRRFPLEKVTEAIERVTSARAAAETDMRIGVVMTAPGNERRRAGGAFIEKWRGVADYVKLQPLLSKAPRQNRCEELWGRTQGRLVVLWDGRVTACCADYDGDLTVGSVVDTPLADLWKGEAMARLRRRHTDGHFPSPCDRCAEEIEEKFSGRAIAWAREGTP